MTMVFSHTDQVQNISIPAEGKTMNGKAFDICYGTICHQNI